MGRKFNTFDKIKSERLPALYAEIGLDYETGLPLTKIAEYDAIPVLDLAAWIAFADDTEAPSKFSAIYAAWIAAEALYAADHSLENRKAARAAWNAMNAARPKVDRHVASWAADGLDDSIIGALP